MQQFSGIAEKLVRAEENLYNLDSEVGGFFEECRYPVFPQNDNEALFKAIEYHKNLVVPPRFSVLAGEIIHHFRSCFDHIIWHFSVQPIKNIRKIEFPIFDQWPANHDSRKLFEGKIEGVTSPNVRSLIERLQPYNAPDPLNDPLWIIHDFDVIDKHRELVVCIGTPSMVFPAYMGGIIERYKKAHPDLDPNQIASRFKSHGAAQPYISFRDFGGRKIEPIIPGLTQLFNYTVSAVKSFQVL